MSAGLVMCLAAGTSVCGTSAIAAIKSAIGANQEESVLAISIVSFMTIFFMLGLPYFAVRSAASLPPPTRLLIRGTSQWRQPPRGHAWAD